MTGTPAFALFGGAHLAALTAVVIAALAVAGLARHDRRRHLAAALAVFLVAHEFVKLWLFIGVDGQSWRLSLPLDLCRANALLCAYLLLRRSYPVFEVSYFWAMAGSSSALLTPDLRQGFPDVHFLTFFAGHGSGIVAVCYAMGGYGFRPTRRSLGRALIVTAVYAVLIGLLNLALDTNYLFLRRKPEAASVLDLFGPWPWYVAGLLVVAALACVVVWLPFARRPAAH